MEYDELATYMLKHGSVQLDCDARGHQVSKFEGELMRRFEKISRFDVKGNACAKSSSMEPCRGHISIVRSFTRHSEAYNRFPFRQVRVNIGQEVYGICSDQDILPITHSLNHYDHLT